MKSYLKKIYEVLTSGIAYCIFCLLKWAPVQYYQPLYGADRKQITRACEDRWACISRHISPEPGSVLDIGCNLGYFTFRVSEHNKMAIGVDADPFYMIACRSIKRRQKIQSVFFLKELITRDFLLKMPSFNTVFNFSVFHHWVKEYGQETAIEMMKILSSKTQTLFFETGQSDEKGTKWANKLSFMGESPKDWISEFLVKDCGFRQVEVIGTFETGLTSTKRFLFHATK